MCSFKWFSVVTFLLLAVAKFSYAGIEELPGLMKWKKKHHDHALVLAFDRNHGEAPIPTPGHPPSASDMERINKYIEDLKGLKLAVEPTATQPVRGEGGFNPFQMGTPLHGVPNFPGGIPKFDGGMPPMFGGKPPEDMREVMELMQWKASHQDHTLVKKFERTHKEPCPTPGQPPDLESMKQYIAELKNLKKAVESTASLDIKRAIEHSDAVKPRVAAVRKLQTTSDSCKTDSGSLLQSKIEELQLQVVHLSKKLTKEERYHHFQARFQAIFPPKE